MLDFEKDTMLVQDREDLIAVLRMRFGNIPPEMIQEIYQIDELDELQRLILAAANVPSWEVFQKEFSNRKGAFRIAGELYDPLEQVKNSEDKK
jgi:hypothetical protein